MGIIQSIAKIALAPSVAIGNLVTAGLEKITGKTYGRTTAEQASKTTFGKVLGTAIAGTATALGVAVAGGGSVVAGASKIASNVGKAIATSSLKTKAVLGATALVAVPAVLENPKIASVAVEKAVDLPFDLANVGSNIGKLTKNPSLETAKELITENPAIVGGALAVGGLALAKGVGGTIATLSNTLATKENTKAMETPQVIVQKQASNPIVTEKSIGDATTPIVSPQTSTISTTKRRKRAKIKTSPSINNNVRVNVQNNVVGALNRKYIKGVVYA